MESLRLPELLRGRWEHLLILTFGVDVPFFENALLRQLGRSCTNKIVLANGDHYLQACSQHSGQEGLVRYVNNHYVLEGVFCPNVSHAKLVLLTNKNRGRLLVGSGNLSYQGYASGGELFTVYEYSDEATENLPEFVAVRHILEELIDLGYLGLQAVPHIQNHLFSRCEWLFSEPHRTPLLNSNLHESFLTQLERKVAGRHVDEVWIMAPFYDEDAAALETLLATVKPHVVNIVLQKRFTSVDPKRLADVAGQYVHPVQLWEIERDDNPYIHAKAILLRCGDRGICLQGSPNMSRVAFLRHGSSANFEIANVLEDEYSAFEHIIDKQFLTPVTDIDELGLVYHSDHEDVQDIDTQGLPVVLRSASWHNHSLTLQVSEVQFSDSVAFSHITLNETRLQAHIADMSNGTMIRLHLPEQSKREFEAANLHSLTLGLTIDGEIVETNPVFVCNVSNLNKILEVDTSEESLQGLRGLNVEDEEFETLILELKSALVIDTDDFWQIAKNTRTADKRLDVGTQGIEDYDSLDYDELRKHPKLLQYATIGKSKSAYQQTQLQQILNAIVSSFEDFVSPQEGTGVIDLPAAVMTDDLLLIEDMEELEEREAENEEQEARRKRSTQNRIKRLLTNFIKKYIAGANSAKFRQAVGTEVITHNYVIFVHILWHLYFKEWLDADFITESLVQTFVSHWGDSKTPGYFEQIGDDEWEEIQAYLWESKAFGQLLACVSYGGFLCRSAQFDQLLLQLRDFWRYFLVSKYQGVLVSQAFEDADTLVQLKLKSAYPTDYNLIEELDALLWFDTRDSFGRFLRETSDGFVDSIRFDVTKMNFGNVPRMLISVQHAPKNPYEFLASILYCWMRFDPNHNFYRIEVKLPETSEISYAYLVQYGDIAGYRLFHSKLTNEQRDFDEVPMPNFDWLESWLQLAEQSGA